MLRQVQSKLRQYHNSLRDASDSYLFNTRKSVRTPQGFQLQGGGSIHHHRMQTGTFEEEETALIIRHVSESQVFVDVGANIGYYSCLARSLGRRVIAVEPLAENRKHLYANLKDNNWDDVEVFPVALSSEPGLATLYGASSTGASLIGSWAGASQRFRRIVPLSTLDILLGQRFAGARLIIKVDVEGVEYEVLSGARNTMALMPRPKWIVEVCLNEFHPDGLNPKFLATFELFWQQGYEIRTADMNNTLIRPRDVRNWVRAGHTDSGSIGYLCTWPESSARGAI